jgi:hypothetical protein
MSCEYNTILSRPVNSRPLKQTSSYRQLLFDTRKHVRLQQIGRWLQQEPGSKEVIEELSIQALFVSTDGISDGIASP